MSSSDDKSLSLLNRWKKDSSQLAVMLASKDSVVKVSGTLTMLLSTQFRLKGEGGSLWVSFAGASFTYSEPDSAPHEIRASSEDKFVCCLVIELPSGIRCALYEKWLAPDSGTVA